MTTTLYVTFIEFSLKSLKFQNSYFCIFLVKPVETLFPLYGSLWVTKSSCNVAENANTVTW